MKGNEKKQMENGEKNKKGKKRFSLIANEIFKKDEEEKEKK